MPERFYPVTAKCLKCPDGEDLHTVMLPYIPDRMPRIYCERHEAIREHSDYAEAYQVGRMHT
jgi:hypothetical protein